MSSSFINFEYIQLKAMEEDNKTIKIYKGADTEGSTLGNHSIIGDFSRVRYSSIGNYCKIDRNNFLLNVKMGNYSYTGPFDMIFKCNIGAFCSISYGVTIGPPEHNYHLPTTHPFVYNKEYQLINEKELLPNNKFVKSCNIGNDVWIGCNVTILRGVKICDGAIVGANSLVNKDVPPYAIVAGCPAKIIKYRFTQDVINKLLEHKWWDWDDEKIRNNSTFFKKEIISIEDINNII